MLYLDFVMVFVMTKFRYFTDIISFGNIFNWNIESFPNKIIVR